LGTAQPAHGQLQKKKERKKERIINPLTTHRPSPRKRNEKMRNKKKEFENEWATSLDLGL
jgi:hypothetical protein